MLWDFSHPRFLILPSHIRWNDQLLLCCVQFYLIIFFNEPENIHESTTQPWSLVQSSIVQVLKWMPWCSLGVRQVLQRKTRGGGSFGKERKNTWNMYKQKPTFLIRKEESPPHPQVIGKWDTQPVTQPCSNPQVWAAGVCQVTLPQLTYFLSPSSSMQMVPPPYSR